MSILLDVIVVAIVVLFALLGLRKGFIKSLAGFVGSILALILALTIARFAAEFVFNTWIKDSLIQTVSDALAENGANTAQGVLDALPDYLTSIFGWAGGQSQSLESALNSSSNAVSSTIINVLSPAIINLLMIVLAIVLFILLMIVIRLIIRLLDRIVQVPVLKQVNGILGFLFGIGKGVIIAWLLCALVMAVLPLWMQESGQWLQDAVNGSYLFRALAGANPISIWLFS